MITKQDCIVALDTEMMKTSKIVIQLSERKTSNAIPGSEMIANSLIVILV